MVDFKLSNIVLGEPKMGSRERCLYYRANDGVATFDYDELGDRMIMRLTGEVDFLTYLNSCSICKWRKYAGVDQVILHLDVRGEGEVSIEGIAHGSEDRFEVLRQSVSGERSLVIPIDGRDIDVIGFTLRPSPGGSMSLLSGCYTVSIDEAKLNPVRLAVSTTTFSNERYILPNIELVKSGIAGEGGKLAEGFHMFVVDNGRTLDAEKLSDDVVTVIPNPNVGGSGGFARGMMAATEEPGAFTHVILMDDDVRMLPESFVRTFALLSLAQGKYRHAFVQGAMLSLEEPTRQYEDVSHVIKSGAYKRIKHDLDVSEIPALLENERTDIEDPMAYGAWWYSCIPVEAIEKNGLPVPFFVRCDDVEFGVRNHPVYMTMNGICVWHASFEGRFRASVDCYQFYRNFLAMIALHDCASEPAFILRIRRTVRQNLRDMDYAAAELTLDGLEDYLKGPEYLAEVDGSKLMKENGARNERLTPVAELDRDIMRRAGVTEEVLSSIDYHSEPSSLVKLWRTLPYDKHYLPDFITRRRIGFVAKNGSSTMLSNSYGCGTLVFLNPTREFGAVRHMDRKRFRAILDRERALMRRYRAERESVRASWKSALPRLTSREFWLEYLDRRK